jgi:hypothetical protein
VFRSALLFVLLCTALASVAAALTPDWSQVAVLDFAQGAAELTPDHRAALDGLLTAYPIAKFEYSFEGDHSSTPYHFLRPQASLRVNERLAETRWEAAANYLGVEPIGSVRATGMTQVRVFTRPRAEAAAAATPVASIDADSIQALHRQIGALGERLRGLEAANDRMAHFIETKVTPDTVFRGIELESAVVSVDKRTSDRFYEASGGVELGLFRTFLRGERQSSGVVFALSNGSAAYSGLQLSLVFDDLAFGNERCSLSPVVTWYDPNLRAAIGSDQRAQTQLFYRADPAVTVGLRATVKPWIGGKLHVGYLGVGAQVHEANRPLHSFDLVDARFTQRLRGPAGVEAVAIYDERFSHEMSYFAGYGSWQMFAGRDQYTLRAGIARQLQPMSTGRYVNAASFGITYTH